MRRGRCCAAGWWWGEVLGIRGALPEPSTERDLQESRKDFATAGQQVEWLEQGRRTPVARLGAVRTLCPLPKPQPHQRLVWQQGPD